MSIPAGPWPPTTLQPRLGPQSVPRDCGAIPGGGCRQSGGWSAPYAWQVRHQMWLLPWAYFCTSIGVAHDWRAANLFLAKSWATERTADEAMSLQRSKIDPMTTNFGQASVELCAKLGQLRSEAGRIWSGIGRLWSRVAPIRKCRAASTKLGPSWVNIGEFWRGLGQIWPWVSGWEGAQAKLCKASVQGGPFCHHRAPFPCATALAGGLGPGGVAPPSVDKFASALASSRRPSRRAARATLRLGDGYGT